MPAGSAAFLPAPGLRFRSLWREAVIVTNATQLRALHSASLGGDGVTMEPAARLMLDASFGSVERWCDEFTSLEGRPRRRHGAAALR